MLAGFESPILMLVSRLLVAGFDVCGCASPSWHEEKALVNLCKWLCRYRVVAWCWFFSCIIFIVGKKKWFWSWFPWWEKHLICCLFIHGCPERKEEVSAISWWWTAMLWCSRDENRMIPCFESRCCACIFYSDHQLMRDREKSLCKCGRSDHSDHG